MEDIGNFFSENFGWETTTNFVKSETEESLNLIFFKLIKTRTISYDIEKGESKTVTVYADTTDKNVGIKVTAGDVTGDIKTGLDGLLSLKGSIKVDDTTYSLGHNEKLLFSDYTFSVTNGNVTESYTIQFDKLSIAAVFVPVAAGGKVVGGIASFFKQAGKQLVGVFG